MAATDTSPAALRALADYWASEKPAGVDPNKPGTLDAVLEETGAKMAETIAALQSLAGQKESLNSTLRFVWGAEIGDLVAKLADAEMRLAALAAEKEAAPLYRFLSEGDLIEVGDENPDDDAVWWQPVGKLFVGMPYRAGLFKAVRRLVAAEKEAGAPAPDAEGWIPWFGGECPVDDGKLVCVRFRGGTEDRDIAGSWVWSHDLYESDIIAYRLSKKG